MRDTKDDRLRLRLPTPLKKRLRKAARSDDGSDSLSEWARRQLEIGANIELRDDRE